MRKNLTSVYSTKQKFLEKNIYYLYTFENCVYYNYIEIFLQEFNITGLVKKRQNVGN